MIIGLFERSFSHFLASSRSGRLSEPSDLNKFRIVNKIILKFLITMNIKASHPPSSARSLKHRATRKVTLRLNGASVRSARSLEHQETQKVACALTLPDVSTTQKVTCAQT